MLKKLVLILFCTVQVYSINLLLLKGTTAALPQSEYRYALYHGIPFAEGVSENMYRTGDKNIKTQLDFVNGQHQDQDRQQAAQNVTKWIAELPESATSKLLSQFYYQAAGGQFQLTTAPNNPATHLKAEHIGNILRILSAGVQSNLAPEALKAKITEYLVGLKLKKSSGSLFAAKDYKALVGSLVDSLSECNPQNPSATFAPGTTEGILLGYCLGRCEFREDLQKFLEGLTGKAVTLPDQEYTKAEITEILQKGVQLQDAEKFAEWLTSATYNKKYMSSLPKIVPNKSVSYEGVSFPDCVETTVRNLCNIATYNGTKLGVAAKDMQLSSALEKFYQQGQAAVPAEVGNTNVHQAWTDVIENMPGASYNRIKLQGQNDTTYLPSEYEGFMPVNDSIIPTEELKKLPQKQMTIGGKSVTLYEKMVGNAKYLVVPQDSGCSCYELLPTTSNMVVCLNDLFNLKLYEPHAIFTPTFAQNYFNKACDKLGWRVQTPVQDNTASINVDICKDASCFQVGLSRKAHGSVTVTKAAVSQDVSVTSLTRQSYQDHAQKTAELVTVMGADSTMEQLFDITGKNPKKFLQLLRNVDITNPDKAVNVIQQIVKLQIQDASLDQYVVRNIMMLPLHDIHYVTSIVKSCKDASDVIKNSLKRYLDLVIIKYGVEDQSLGLIQKLVQTKILTNQDKGQLLSWVEKGMASTHKDVQATVLDLMETLVRVKILTSQDRVQWVSFLEKGMASGSLFILQTVTAEIKELDKVQGLTNQEIMSLLEKGMATGNDYIQKSILSAIDKLGVARKLTSQQIIPLLEKGMKSVSKDTLLVIENLRKAQILTSQEIKLLLENNIVHMNIFGVQSSLSLIEDLAVDKMLTSQEIILLLEKVIVTANSFMNRSILRVIVNLVNAKILTGQEIIPILEKCIASTNGGIQKNILSLIEILAESGILTNQDKEQLLALKEKSAGSAESSSESIASETQGSTKGLLRKTGIAAMRHEPYRASGIGYVIPKDYTDSLEGAQLDEHAELDREFEEHMQDYRDQQARELEQKRFEHEQGFGTSSYRIPQIDTESVQRNLVAGQQTTSAAVDAYHQSTNIPQVSHILPVASMAAQQRAMHLAQARTAKARDMLESVHPERLAKSTLRAGMRK